MIANCDIFLVVSLLFQTTPSTQATEVSALLQHYRESLAPLANCLVEVTEVSDVEEEGVYQPAAQVYWRRCLRAGDRAAVEEKMWTEPDDPANLDDASVNVRIRALQSDGRLMSLQKVTAEGIEEQELFIHENPPRWRLWVWQGGPLSGAGFFGGQSAPIDELLANAEHVAIRPAREQVGDIECIVADFTAESARYSVWFAPSRSYAILKLMWSIEGDPLRQMQQQNVGQERFDELPAERRWKKFQGTLEDVALETHDGKWLPTAGRHTSQTTLEAGQPRGARKQITRKYIDLSPKITDRSFEIEVPDGTPVHFIGKPDGVPREWRGGKVVPREDRSTTDQLRNHLDGQHFQFQEDSTSHSKIWLALAPASVLAAILCTTACRWYFTRSQSRG